MGEQDAQDLELARCEVDPNAGDVDLVPGAVELEGSQDDPASRIGGRAQRRAGGRPGGGR